MKDKNIAELIRSGRAVLGIELGSTRIKAVLIDDENLPIAEGGYAWENTLLGNIWTYSLDDAWKGLRGCYTDLRNNVIEKYGVEITKLAAIGISGMMHGYLAFNADGKLLVPFRTWRNTITEEAADKLFELFNYNIPQRWSIAHLYQAMLNKEPHVSEIDYVCTLSAYIHWKLTGRKVVGVDDASGMFPIDPATRDYDAVMVEKFNKLVEEAGFSWRMPTVFPECLCAGDDAGCLTAEGVKLLDESGTLEAGIPMCPPEGDAGTGMAATNSTAQRTGNVSAGTSIFGSIVLEGNLSRPYREIDMVMTPSGDLCAMAHCNTCTSDLNAWVNIFDEFLKAMGIEEDKGKLFGVLYNKALEGEKDCGGLLDYNYISGEAVTHQAEGRPLFVRTPEARFNLANFMRVHLYASLSVLKIGMDLLLKGEGVKAEKMFGHGGLFKTEGVAQSILAAAINTPVTVMTTAGEGGAWGIALLASYLINKGDMTLSDWLNEKVFGADAGKTIEPDPEDVRGFDEYIAKYIKGLEIENAAVKYLERQ